jgi:uncharacterized membrane protein YhfC
MVPTINMVFMGISAFIAIALPIVLFLFWRKTRGLKFIPLLVGAAVFVVFALILESLLHTIVLHPDPETGYIALTETPALYILYGCLAAGIFEETGRFIAFQLLKRRYSGVSTGLSYGIGHGGIESILLAGLAMISNLVLAFLINSGSTEALAALGPTGPQIIDQLVTAPSALFMLAGFERICAMAIQISLSVIVWYAVTTPGKIWLFPAAIILHGLADVAAAYYQTTADVSIYLVEGSTFLMALILIVTAWNVHKKYKVVETVDRLI